MSESIVILVPVLGRAHAIRPLVDSVIHSSGNSWHIRFLCSPADDIANERCFSYANNDHRISQRIVPWDPGPGDWARKINLGYMETKEEWMLLGATDLKFHAGWDTEALRVGRETGAGVVGTNDLGNATVMRGLHSTHPFVRRSYIDEQGTIDEDGKVLHEGYKHQWVDTEFCETAKARGQWAFAANSHVEHLHPFWKKGQMDATYKKALSTPHEDHRHFGERRKLWHRSSELLTR